MWSHLYLSQNSVILSKLSYLSLVVEESQILELSQSTQMEVISSRRREFFFPCLLEFVLVLILFLLSYYLKLLQFLGMIWCLKKGSHIINYVNKPAKNWNFSAAENTDVSFAEFKLEEQAKNHSISQSVLSSFFPRNWRSFIIKR